MILGVYSLRDALSGFLSPTFESNDQVAYRNFEHVVLEGGSLLSSHAADYTLMKIGTFDSETGQLVSLDPPETIVNGNSILLRVISNSRSDKNEV
ncbi:nonstructural protein [Sigmofec virus UA08Rod_5692]|uniref:Nonstructural protein n=1 Tax=Sigmofec virus UA08Rod_5692 TaxID=2929436 RepID=A0A976R7Z4_9VIRU|nr:nonstructural protein [Sigmofec virus UA08Rod_5692]